MGTKHTGQSVADFKKTAKVPEFTSQTFLSQFLPVIVQRRLAGRVFDTAPNDINGNPVSVKRRQDNLLVTDPDLGNPLLFTHSMNNAAAQSLLENVPKEILSSLQPIVEVYKVIDTGGGNTKDILLPFSNFKDPRKMDPLNRYAGRSPGHLAVGLREFSFDYLGTQPAEVDYWINCKLRLYCSSMDAFFHEYTDKEGYKVSFSDLIKRPTRTNHQRYDSRDFRVRVHVRYLTPDKSVLRDMIKNLGIQKKNKKEFMNNLHAAIKNSSISFFLTLVRHEIDFATDVPSMPFEITIDYNGSVESSLLTDGADLLRNNTGNNHILDQERELRNKTAVQEHTRFIKDKPQFQTLVHNESLVSTLHSYYQSGEPSKGTKDAGEKAILQNLNVELTKAELKIGNFNQKDLKEFSSLTEAKRLAEQSLGLDEASIRASSYNQIMTRLMGLDQHAQNLRSNYRTLELNGDDKKLTDNQKKTLKYSGDAARESRRDGYKNERGNNISGVPLPRRRLYNIMLDVKADLMPWIQKRAITSESTGERGTNAALKRALAEAKRQGNKDDARSLQKKINKNKKNYEKRRDNLTAQSLALAKKISHISTEEIYGSLSTRQANYQRFIKLQGIKKKSPEQARQFDEAQKALAEAKKSSSVAGKDEYQISYFYLGDLLDVALEIVNENNELDRLGLDFWSTKNKNGATKVILGEVEIWNPLKPTEQLRINIADLPVSRELWSDFWVGNVVKKLKTRYTLKHFFRDVTAQLIPNIFPTRYLANGEVNNKVRVNIEHASLAKEFPLSVESVDPGSGMWEAHVLDGGATWEETKKDQEIIYFYGVSIKPTWLSGNKRDDIGQGVLYLPVGQEGTPLETISFSKADQPFYLEAKAEEGGILDDTTQLSEPYHCNFSLVGNTAIKPGRYVHISLPQLGGISHNERHATGALTRGMILGIGGYFLINKVSNTLSANGNRIEWRTKADALWQTFGEKAPLPIHPRQLAVHRAGEAVLDTGAVVTKTVTKGASKVLNYVSKLGEEKIQTEKEELKRKKEQLKTAERKAWKHGGASSVGSK